MKKIYFTFFFSIFTLVPAFAQNTLARLMYADAEDQYYSRNYQQSLSKLKEIETLMKSTNPRVLHLTILNQWKIIDQDPLADYDLLESARKNCQKFINDYKNYPNDENRYQDAEAILQLLSKYPATKEEFDKEAQRIADEKARIALEQRLKKEQEDKLERERIEKEKRERREKASRSGFVALRIGMAMPMNSEAKDQPASATYYSPETGSSPFEKGNFGLKRGFSLGATGVISTKLLDSIVPQKMKLGIAMDLNWTKFKFFLDDESAGISGADARAPGISGADLFPVNKFHVYTLGAGASISYQWRYRKFVHLILRPDLNLIAGGTYYDKAPLQVVYTTSTTSLSGEAPEYQISCGKESRFKVKPGFTIGSYFCLKWFYFGLDLRMGVVDKSDFSIYEYSDSYSTYDSKTKKTTYYEAKSYSRSIESPGIRLSNLSVTIGVNLFNHL